MDRPRTDPYRMAGDPEGVAFDVMVPCPQRGPGVVDFHACRDCDNSGLIPNPAITQECGTCGGIGDVAAADEPSPIPCHSCEGRGYTFRKTVRVAERVRVELWPAHSVPVPRVAVDPISKRVDWTDGWEVQDITHLWPEEPCPRGHFTAYNGKKWHLSGAPCSGTIRTFPKPGELWEIGWREAELVEVVAKGGPWPCSAERVIVADPPFAVIKRWTDNGPRHELAVSHHFPTPPKPGQRAGVLGELVLYEQARRVEP